MEKTLDTQEPESTQLVSFPTVFQSVVGVLGWINQFLSLTDEERSAAGISVSSEHQD